MNKNIRTRKPVAFFEKKFYLKSFKLEENGIASKNIKIQSNKSIHQYTLVRKNLVTFQSF